MYEDDKDGQRYIEKSKVSLDYNVDDQITEALKGTDIN